jgi:hypothetical protein
MERSPAITKFGMLFAEQTLEFVFSPRLSQNYLPSIFHCLLASLASSALLILEIRFLK